MYNIIPQPINILTSHHKKGFTLHSGTTITPSPFSQDFVDFARKALNKKVSVHEDDGEEKSIILTIDDTVEQEEGYRLLCENRRVYIMAKTDSGLLYGLQTLKQMLLQKNGKLPYTEIIDYPRFKYRGFMLDSGRYFYPVEDVKRIIDLMALHKLNVFHWHLTEDQGWRVEIKKYPLLTEKGSKRSRTNFFGKGNQGFYTQEDIKEIVKYCHDRKITVMPEFDIPGHTVSAIACYPYLSCLERELPVATHWGVKHDIFCAGKESTYKFVFDVLDELMELFPDKLIHIGGDEAFKMRWKVCPHCQKAIKELGLHDEDELQMYFMSRVNDYLEKHGFKSVMWNYNSLGSTEKLDPAISWTVCGINSESKLLEKEIARGRRMINSNSFPYYLDFPYGWNSLRRVCEKEPALTDNDEDTWGIEACMWTEYVPDMKKLEFLTFPRLGAIAESAWAEKGYQTFSTFMYKADDYYRLLDAYDIRYAKLNKACPSWFYKIASSLWWDRRVLHWQGLHNIFDDLKAVREAKKIKID